MITIFRIILNLFNMLTCLILYIHLFQNDLESLQLLILTLLEQQNIIFLTKDSFYAMNQSLDFKYYYIQKIIIQEINIVKMYKYCAHSIILNKGEYGNNLLILSDAQVPKDTSMIQKLKICCIISIGEEAAPKKKQQHVKYYMIKLRDQPNEDIKKYFMQVIELIQKYRQIGNVLINCFHGVSRSSSFVIAYLLFKTKMNYQQSFKYVKERRPCISPNQGFKKQLKQFTPNKQILNNQ